jgi:hypothetical protein
MVSPSTPLSNMYRYTGALFEKVAWGLAGFGRLCGSVLLGHQVRGLQLVLLITVILFLTRAGPIHGDGVFCGVAACVFRC